MRSLVDHACRLSAIVLLLGGAVSLIVSAQTTQRILASATLRSTKLFRSLSAAALGDVVVPVQRLFGVTSLGARPATS